MSALTLYIAVIDYDETELYAQTFLTREAAEAGIDDFIRAQWTALYDDRHLPEPCPSGIAGTDLHYAWYDQVGGSIAIITDCLTLPEAS